MSAPALPTTQGAMPAGFATFLANIGQVSTGGEAGGFDQLLAAAPVAAPVATTPIADTITTIQVDTALPGETAAPQIEAPPAEASVAVEAPSLEAEPADADAAALAANLLIALNGSVPAQASAPRPVPAERETETTAAPDGEAVATVAADWTAIVAAATPAAAKPAKPVEAATSDTNAAPAATAQPRMREAASTAPILAGTEPPVAKPADAAPSMAILFTQPAAQGATAIAGGAAPAQLAERVLDMDSDGAWIDQLARDIAATRSDSGDISFRLMPRHLGRLDVAMQMGDEGVALKMDTHHEATATIVTAAQGRLVDELRQQGVRVSGAEVTCTPGETGRQSPNQGQGQGRAAAPDPSHLVETATERADARPKTDSESRAADRRGRFA